MFKIILLASSVRKNEYPNIVNPLPSPESVYRSLTSTSVKLNLPKLFALTERVSPVESLVRTTNVPAAFGLFTDPLTDTVEADGEIL